MTEQGQIEGEMLLNGPVVGLVYLYDDFLVYKSGVYKPMATATCLTDKKGEPLLHAVKIIGWGVSSASEDTGTTSGERYWLIENSFGKDWGEGGYGKIKRGDALAAGKLAEQYDPRMKRDIVLLEKYGFSCFCECDLCDHYKVVSIDHLNDQRQTKNRFSKNQLRVRGGPLHSADGGNQQGGRSDVNTQEPIVTCKRKDSRAVSRRKTQHRSLAVCVTG